MSPVPNARAARVVVALTFPMKISIFVTSTAALLMVWLTVTFFRQVPHENYQLLGRGSLPISAAAEPEPVEDEGMAARLEETDPDQPPVAVVD